MCKKLAVALAHWRDMASHDETWSRAMRGCSCESKVKDLEGLRSRFPLAKSQSASSTLTPPTGKSRKLEPKLSVCSVGSQDIPSLAPSSAMSSSCDASSASEKSAKSVADSIEGEAVAQAMDILPHTRGALKGMVIKRPVGNCPKGYSAMFGQVKLQVASCKSYVQYLNEVDGKWKFIVQSSHECHSDIMRSIFETMQENTMSKDDAMELRDALESLDGGEHS